jgi:hypothetical protein
MKKNTSPYLWLLLGLSLVLTACGPKGETRIDTANTSSNAFLLQEISDSVPDLIEAIQQAEPGKSFLMTGRVGGVVDPLSKDYAAFVLADESLQFCDEMGDDHCPTPWDACCEGPERTAAARAFVQFVDEGGNPLATDLKEAIGLSENDNVIVYGRLSPESTPVNRVILAERMAIVQ